MGCDTIPSVDVEPIIRFQSTHPRGVRRDGAAHAMRQREGFNPRTRVGCDTAWGSHLLLQWRFNPRTRVGCDQCEHVRQVSCGVFQSTHPRGVRHDRAHGFGQVYQGFNPRTRVGCDAPALTNSSTYPAFQSTHPRGVRLRQRCPCCSGPGWRFNPRTRVGCDCFHVLSSRFP